MSLEQIFWIIVVFIFGAIIGSHINIFSSKRRIQKARDEKYGDLKKIYDITQNKMKISVSELSGIIDWTNTELPEMLIVEIVGDPNLTILKNKGGIPDTEYVKAFEEIVPNIQKIVAARFQISLDNINKEVVNNLKELINETVQKK